MLHEHLKQLRLEHDFTLKELASKVGYGTGNLSSYENGKLNAKDDTLIRILTRGYGFTKKEAKVKIAQWRKEEVEEVYHFELSQVVEPYNKGVKKVSLDEFLKAEGFDAKTILEIKQYIEKYR